MSFDQLNWVPARTANAVCALFLRDDISFASEALKCTPDFTTSLATANPGEKHDHLRRYVLAMRRRGSRATERLSVRVALEPFVIISLS